MDDELVKCPNCGGIDLSWVDDESYQCDDCGNVVYSKTAEI